MSVVLLVAALGLGLLWREQERVAAALIARTVPQLHYRRVELDAAAGRLALRGVDWRGAGVELAGSGVTILVDPDTLWGGEVRIRRLVLQGGRVTLEPERFALGSGSETDLALPERIDLSGVEFILRHRRLARPLTLRLDGSLLRRGALWRMRRWRAGFAGGTVELSGEVDPSRGAGEAVVHGLDAGRLMRLAGRVRRQEAGTAAVDGRLRWRVAWDAPERADVEGELALREVRLRLGGALQRLERIDVGLAWHGDGRRLRLSRVALRGGRFHWRGRWPVAKRSGRGRMRAVPMPAGLSWRIDRMEAEESRIDLELTTAAGMVRMPVRIPRMEVDALASGGGAPGRVDALLALAEGRGRLRL
ncbi:MAG: hypothetical protein D6682_01735, partial [Zetaproteobacteria bacterium]